MLIIIVILFNFFSFSYNDKDKKINNRVSSIIQLHYGVLFPNQNFEFFEIYKKDIGGKNQKFRYGPSIGITNKFNFKDNYRIGVSLSRFEIDFYDEYEQPIYPNSLSNRYVVQNINWQDYPVLFLFEYNPNKKNQFKSYIGGGLGVVVSNVYWNEEIETFDWDVRKGGVVYDELKFFPIARFYFGTELGFDKENNESLLGGITIEPRINYIYRYIDFFSPVSVQVENAYYGINKNIWFNNFIFEFNVGLTLNFYYKK